jgi:hypothetical protein
VSARCTALDDWLAMLMQGQPPVPRQYQLRCHPDVYLALREAAYRQEAEQEYQPDPSLETGSPLYGQAEIIVVPGLGPGGWELHREGGLLRSGRLQDAEACPRCGSPDLGTEVAAGQEFPCCNNPSCTWSEL